MAAACPVRMAARAFQWALDMRWRNELINKQENQQRSATTVVLEMTTGMFSDCIAGGLPGLPFCMLKNKFCKALEMKGRPPTHQEKKRAKKNEQPPPPPPTTYQSTELTGTHDYSFETRRELSNETARWATRVILTHQRRLTSPLCGTSSWLSGYRRTNLKLSATQ